MKSVTSKSIKWVLSSITVLVTGTVFAVSTIDHEDNNVLHSFGEIKDPYFGEALYSYYKQNYFLALSQSLVALNSERLSDNSIQAQQLLSELYISYGLLDQSKQTLLNLKKKSGSQNIQGHAWLDLAKANYHRGLYKDAEIALDRIRDNLDGEFENERQALQGALLLSRGAYKTAASVYKKLKGRSEWRTYGQYNLGIALLNLGQFKEGVNELRIVGKRNFSTPEMRALKDRANVALGFLYLRSKESELAIEHLEKVRLDSIHSSRALLGIGWARMMVNQYEEALAPLLELRNRSTSDPAVLEGYLAAPYAFRNAQSYNQAINYYDSAVKVFENEIEQIKRIVKKLNNQERFITLLEGDPQQRKAWLKRLEGWPKSTESRIFTRLLSDQWFSTTLTNYQDLRDLQKRLNNWSTIIDVYDQMLSAQRKNIKLDSIEFNETPEVVATQSTINLLNERSTAYSHLQLRSKRSVDENIRKIKKIKKRNHNLIPEINSEIETHEQYLKKLVLSELDREKKRVTKFLTLARFSMAQIYDQLLSQGEKK